MPSEKPKLDPKRYPVHSFESKEREKKGFGTEKIAWNRGFREMLRENPGIIKTAIALMDRVIGEYRPTNVKIGGEQGTELRYDKKRNKWIEQNTADEKELSLGKGTVLVPGQPIVDEATGLEVILLGRSNIEKVGSYATRFDVGDYFRINFNGQSFFVKRSFITTNPAFEEFHNSTKAKEALKKLDFVKVVDAHLAFQDSKQSWYVSSWEELESAGFATWDALVKIGWDEYGNKIAKISEGWADEAEMKKECGEIEEKVDKIIARLAMAKMIDITANLFYNRKTKKFILLDPTNVDLEGVIGEPIRQSK